ncbi:Cof-type HAD-IIB family hydrolase [Vibrio spartinae]|uniref:Pyridoxal phosphate phosphatase YbhA n=1 Tax=Vibrio spartinae TaxID=1918945 RepID=A0A1N6M8L3_9VIBR|nr:Cof-type HAD-IIB family hydrolase [Vibrio spartinae]QMV13566.1 Pyridoxal phosphate phosphatase YbhA [Vibrio spartinae]SIO95781.1 Pyridoxal phosphate phosphatase YbhA [Vibrio spartinae]
MYKVLALDLDGTVLTDDHTIHPEVKQAIHAAQQQCHVVIVTGRHHTAARPYYLELGLNTPIICCNGTYVYDYQNEAVLQYDAIAKDDARKFIDLATQYQMKMVLYVTDTMNYAKQNPIVYMEALEKWANQYPESIRPQIHRIDSFHQLVEQADHVWKFVVEGVPSSVERLSEHPWVKETFNGEFSWSNRIDFAAKGNNKGKRLAEYVAALGYDANHVIAIGDNHNDISMLTYAGLGVAMANADDTVKSHAKQVCQTDNNSDGLAHLIRQKIQG